MCGTEASKHCAQKKSVSQQHLKTKADLSRSGVQIGGGWVSLSIYMMLCFYARRCARPPSPQKRARRGVSKNKSHWPEQANGMSETNCTWPIKNWPCRRQNGKSTLFEQKKIAAKANQLRAIFLLFLGGVLGSLRKKNLTEICSLHTARAHLGGTPRDDLLGLYH
jgi:hypothetical protein